MAKFKKTEERVLLDFNVNVRVSIGQGYSRPCPSCGEPQLLELRHTANAREIRIYDQPKCGTCRRSKKVKS